MSRLLKTLNFSDVIAERLNPASENSDPIKSEFSSVQPNLIVSQSSCQRQCKPGMKVWGPKALLIGFPETCRICTFGFRFRGYN